MRIEKISDWLEWDIFISNLKGSSFLALSNWLQTYCIIPLFIKKIGYFFYKNDELVGGISGIKMGFWKFSIIVFPSSIYFIKSIDEEIQRNILLSLVKEKDIANARFVQFVLKNNISPNFNLFKVGKVLKMVYLNSGFGLIKIQDNNEMQLENFKMNTRRNIRASLKHNMTFEKVTQHKQLTLVYSLLKQNAVNGGYKIRPFIFYKRSWKTGMKNETSFFYLIYYQGELKGTIWLMYSGKMLHNIMAATVKDKPRLDIGYFIQWNVIQEAIKQKHEFYNISTGGSPGVKKFKSDFGSEEICDYNYYYIKNKFWKN